MNDAELIRLIDELEAKADGYITLEHVEAAVGHRVTDAVTAGIVLVDHRTRLDGTTVTLCRLNRHHPSVAQLTGW